jgi:hypothetical protein
MRLRLQNLKGVMLVVLLMEEQQENGKGPSVVDRVTIMIS